MIIRLLLERLSYKMALYLIRLRKQCGLKENYFLIQSFTFGTRNRVKAMQGIKTHRTLMSYPDKLKKNDINLATKPTVTINPLQPII